MFICIEQSKNLTYDLPWFQLPQFLELLCSDSAQWNILYLCIWKIIVQDQGIGFVVNDL